MALIKSVRGKTPLIGEGTWFAENATIIGDVQFGKNCSVWFSAVVRGDVNQITIGDNVNIQDGAVVHCTYEKTTTVIGDNVSIGHNAIVHGCRIHDQVLVGMGAIIMDGAEVCSNVIIAAGSVVTQNTILVSNFIYAGVPARKVKPIDESNSVSDIEAIAKSYKTYANWFREEE
jgi:carbonic anhydrase/acetyltransferase-like protein (isoleucine patch superfamily)